jgi:PepSY-associated TM region
LRSPTQFALRAAIFCHRWLGFVLCPFVIFWFASGIVMMYWGFPEVSQDERFARTDTIDPSAIRVSPEAAYGKLGWAGSPENAEISALNGRPVYRFRNGNEHGIVFADTGDLLGLVTPEFALREAAYWTGHAAEQVRFEGAMREPDQWTVSGEFRALRPLFKFAWPDGEEVYVSGRNGEVVQRTTRKTRLAAYFGAIPHWLYWTPLRKDGRQWYRVVVGCSSALVCVGLLGLLVGAWMYSPTARYRFRGTRSSIPYEGQKRWHMILGLVFGLLICTWAFSGLLSMEPFEWLSGNLELAGKVDAALRGGALQLEEFTAKLPAEALKQAGIEAKRAELVSFDGRPYYLVRSSARVSRIVPVQGGAIDQFDQAVIFRIARDVSQPAAVEEARVVSRYDAYYLDRHGQHPLPAFLLRLNDANQSAFYIDLKTARLVEAYDRRARWNRWLYHGLHSWNLPWLYSHRPAWDGVMIVLLAGGLALGVTAVILAFQFVRRMSRSSPK